MNQIILSSLLVWMAFETGAHAQAAYAGSYNSIAGYYSGSAAGYFGYGTTTVSTTVSTTAMEEAATWVRNQATMAGTNNLTLVCYEGGQHFTGIEGAEENTELVDVLLAANRDARMEDRYR